MGLEGIRADQVEVREEVEPDFVVTNGSSDYEQSDGEDTSDTESFGSVGSDHYDEYKPKHQGAEQPSGLDTRELSTRRWIQPTIDSAFSRTTIRNEINPRQYGETANAGIWGADALMGRRRSLRLMHAEPDGPHMERRIDDVQTVVSRSLRPSKPTPFRSLGEAGVEGDEFGCQDEDDEEELPHLNRTRTKSRRLVKSESPNQQVATPPPSDMAHTSEAPGFFPSGRNSAPNMPAKRRSIVTLQMPRPHATKALERLTALTPANTREQTPKRRIDVDLTTNRGNKAVHIKDEIMEDPDIRTEAHGSAAPNVVEEEDLEDMELELREIQLKRKLRAAKRQKIGRADI
ncbi:hypothetical protein LTR37_004216 [Vermiconidia calcicola]|uniref:Uncharacterized protein n=1 Tax=Vermiconidia calcicola TaxID=1690605 RepID=A0ACC3NMK3_9PEZI|nr:hypothetical protein LTR37_004216 [Vermiconidia calcicola]